MPQREAVRRGVGARCRCPIWWTPIPLRTNPLLVGGVLAELAMLAVFLYVPPIADLLDQAGPTVAGFAIAVLAIPAVLAADAAQKLLAGRHHSDRTETGPSPLGVRVSRS